MPRLSLYFFGSFEARLDDSPVSGFDSDKVRALLAFLILEAGRPHTREYLAGLLWPDFSESAARANLRNSLSNLRHVLGEAHASQNYFAVTPESIQFNPSSDYWCDVTAFEQECQAFHPQTMDPEQTGSSVNQLEAAIVLYRGSFLEGFSLKDSPAFDDWLFLMRERLQRQAMAVLYHLAEHYIQRNDFVKASLYAYRQVELEPWQEEAHRQLMRLLALSGKRTAALAQFDLCRSYLAKELAVEPLTETIQLYEQIRDGQIRSAAETHERLHNLPAALSPLVGREHELSLIDGYLHDPACRLLTLVGPGGSGKTRLALEAGMKQLGNFEQGVFLVFLAPLQSPDEIIPTIAQALNFSFQATGEPVLQLRNYLHNKKILLLLDNFEHLLEGVPCVLEILRSTPDVKILVTSRSRLKAKDETIVPVTGLDIPEASAEKMAFADRQAILQSAAVRLFSDMSRRVQPDFEPTLDDLTAMVDICQLVQGMPLWILLASSWLGVLKPGEIAAEIRSHSLDFLETDWQDLPERQRSLRAVFSHSWRLLSDREKEAFAALSVFRGGFTIPAVQEVTGISLHELMGLSDKMLVHRSSAGRFELHELLRQFSVEKMSTSPEYSESIHDRHCAYFCQSVGRWEQGVHGAQQQTAMQEMAVDFENVQDAWKWAVEKCQEERIYQVLDGLGEYSQWYGRYQDGEKAFNTVVTVFSGSPYPGDAERNQARLHTLARALAWQGSFKRILGQMETALTLINQGLHLIGDQAIDASDFRADKAFLLRQKGQIIYSTNPEEAYPFYQQSLDLYRDLEDSWRAAQIMVRLGQVNNFLGKYTDAKQLIEESLAIRRSMQDWRGIADSLVELFTTTIGDGKVDELDQTAQELFQILRQIGNQSSIAESFYMEGMKFCVRGLFKKSRQALVEALDLYTEMGMCIQIAWTKCMLGWSEANLGLYPQSNANINASLVIAGQVGLDDVLAMDYMGLGGNELVEQAFPQALWNLEKSVSIYRQMNNQSEIGLSLATLAEAERRSGKLVEARQHLSEALCISLNSNSWETKVTCIIAYSSYLLDQHAYEKAVEFYALACQLPYISNSRYREDFAGKFIAQVAARLPEDVVAAAKRRGQARDLDMAVKEVLAELHV